MRGSEGEGKERLHNRRVGDLDEEKKKERKEGKEKQVQRQCLTKFGRGE